jgi:hypothetical protein
MEAYSPLSQELFDYSELNFNKLSLFHVALKRNTVPRVPSAAKLSFNVDLHETDTDSGAK